MSSSQNKLAEKLRRKGSVTLSAAVSASATYASPLPQSPAGGCVGTVGSQHPTTPIELAEYTPFPVAALPPRLRQLVHHGATSIGCDPSMIALPGLATLAAAVGGTRAVEIKPDWSEPCILWAVVIGESSARKSPGFELATAPLVELQRDYFREHADLIRAHGEVRTERYGRTEPRPCRRVVVDDTTIDALALILRDNPRGVLVACEELDSWFQSFTRYSAGGATDRPRWLKLYGGRTLIVDRKGGGTIGVPRAVASITGTIQPGVFSRAMTWEARESGLAARYLLAMPPRQPRRWIDAPIPPTVSADYRAVVRSLHSIPTSEFDGDHRPTRIPLSPMARDAYVSFVNRVGIRADEAEKADIRAVLGKIEGTAARLALVHQLASEEDDPTLVAEVGRDAMEAGIQLADWFAGEVVRVYGLIEETDGERGRRGLVEMIRTRGGAVTPRDVQRASRRFRTTEQAQAALDELVRSGYGKWVEFAPGQTGGRRTVRFQLFPPADC